MASSNPDSTHETQIRSRRGFDGKLLHVRVDDVRLPLGRESVREVVEHPGAVAIVALTERDELILVRQWRYAVQEELFEVPAGTRDRDETLEQTALRELREETGYLAAEAVELTSFYSSAGYSTEELTIFLAERCVAVDKPIDEDEHTVVVLVPRDQIEGLVSGPTREIRDAKSLVGILALFQRWRATEE